MSWSKWKEIVSCKVEATAFSELCITAMDSSKTKNVKYESFKCQRNLFKLDAKSARRIARIRSRTLVCKANHKNSYNNLSCRAGCDEIETQDHVLNCVYIHGEVEPLYSSVAYEIDKEVNWSMLREVMRRIDSIESFMDSK